MGSLADAFRGLLDPWMFIALSLYYIPPTIFSLLRARDFETLLSWPRFQSAWFGRYWAWLGPGVRQTGEQRVLPLLEGRVRGGKKHDSAVMPPVSGIVIEVGAGSGMWADVFTKVSTASTSEGGAPASTARNAAGAANGGAGGAGELRKRTGLANDVTKVYGVEPNAGSHSELRRRTREAGLEGIYEIVPVGIESLADSELWDGKIEEGSVDCVVSILCLCSIPDPQKNVAALHKLLKKGGRWYVYEHVRATNNLFMRLYQSKLAPPR